MDTPNAAGANLSSMTTEDGNGICLLIDIGNSTIALALADGEGNISEEWRFKTMKSETLSFFRKELEFGIAKLKAQRNGIEKVIVSSVVPELKDVMSQAISDVVGCIPHFFSVQDARKIINIDIDSPTQLGNDRLADAIGAAAHYGVPCIAIDMGTATTIGVVNADNTFIGGMIIPGVKTSLKALSSRASQLPTINIERPRSIIGKNTVECMQSGIVFGTAAMIDGVIDQISAELGTSVNIVATGGMSKQIVPFCKHDIKIDRCLQFKGLLECTK